MRRFRSGFRPIGLQVLIAMLIGVAGCGGGKVELGAYRAVLTLPGGELPFGFELVQESGSTVAYLVNGPERVRIPDVRLEGSGIDMIIPGFGNRLKAKRRARGLKGEVLLIKTDGREHRIPFAAELGASHRFFKEPVTDNADLSGRWAVTFTGSDGKSKAAVAEFQQTFDRVTGTFLTSTGDHRYLAGEVRNDELYLSAFDGAHAGLYHAKLSESGDLVGKHWSGLSSTYDWVAKRDEQATLADADTLTTIRDDTWSFGFTFPDQAGKPVSLADQRFRNKVVIVTVVGSWCGNSHDEAAFLAPFYKEWRDQGVEVVALMFERTDDFEPAAAAVNGYRDKFDIEFTTLIAGTADKREAASKLPQLSGIHAYPTTLFIDRSGRVRRIYTGFSGPATGPHYDRLVASFTETTEALLNEKSQ